LKARGPVIMYHRVYMQDQNKDTALFANYDNKSHILSATNNVLPLTALHFQ